MTSFEATAGSSVTRWRSPWWRRLWLAPVRFYQRVISPLTPGACRFSPTCSQYAIEAVEQRGVLRGTALAIWRVIRCNPFCRGGHDPVLRPASGSGDEEGP